MAKDFVFTYEGVEHWVDDLTIAEAVEAEEQIGPWATWRPLWESKHRLVLTTVFLRRTRSAEDVEEILKGMSLKESLKLWEIRDESLPDVYEDGLPKAAAEASTPT